jgi:hypothetical protein
LGDLYNMPIPKDKAVKKLMAVALKISQPHRPLLVQALVIKLLTKINALKNNGFLDQFSKGFILCFIINRIKVVKNVDSETSTLPIVNLSYFINTKNENVFISRPIGIIKHGSK